MARPLRFQYSGAVYHVMARGDGGKMIFDDDQDRKGFLFRLSDVCESHGWSVHAWVLMGNHFHLLLETPQANLVSGMKLLLGTFSQSWNRKRLRRGHVFQGRYKAVPVNGSESDPYYFRIVADYIHLNPARAGLTGGEKGTLSGYEWSSLPAYQRGKAPKWLVMDRVLSAFELAKDGRGRRAYVDWLEARAANDGGEIDEKAMQALRRGWYLGEEGFKNRLIKLLKGPVKRSASGKSHSGEALRDRGESEAQRILEEGTRLLELPLDHEALADFRKNDQRKVLLARILRARTTIPNDWIAKRLAMGHPGSVSRLVSASRKDRELNKECDRLSKLLLE